MVEGTTGRTVGTVLVGQAPTALAVDAQSGRAFVINEAGTVAERTGWWDEQVQGLLRWLPWQPQQAATPVAGSSSVSVFAAR
jgi:hypothetical protein